MPSPKNRKATEHLFVRMPRARVPKRVKFTRATLDSATEGAVEWWIILARYVRDAKMLVRDWPRRVRDETTGARLVRHLKVRT